MAAASLEEAKRAYALDQFLECIELCREVVRSDPEQSEAHQLLCNAIEASGNFEEGVNTFDLRYREVPLTA